MRDNAFSPLHLMSQAEKDEMARRFGNLHVRPHTDDYEWWDRMMARGVELESKADKSR